MHTWRRDISGCWMRYDAPGFELCRQRPRDGDARGWYLHRPGAPSRYLGPLLEVAQRITDEYIAAAGVDGRMDPNL